MDIKNAEFVKSSQTVQQFPAPDRPEYAFTGRSNVGKSSLINYLCNRKNLAKTSSTPGKTQLVNHFLINDYWYLVDLPGYGYAKISKKIKQGFAGMIEDYLLNRENLVNIFVLIDSKIPPQDIDLDFIDYLGGHELPFSIVFTKTDKAKRSEFAKNQEAFKNEMNKSWEELPPMFYTSSSKRKGKEELLAYINDCNKLFS
ncbi:MAG: ribosome biogenesis GTP-binding protein YihA/YsxC [Bacteroidia bacterium]|nr:ribosome biogenesis GTP-binding protein YihA/YsxC [Bacteroidia bacterium]